MKGFWQNLPRNRVRAVKVGHKKGDLLFYVDPQGKVIPAAATKDERNGSVDIIDGTGKKSPGIGTAHLFSDKRQAFIKASKRSPKRR